MVLNMTLSNRGSMIEYGSMVVYYNKANIRSFLAQRSKPTTKLTSKLTYNSFRA